MRRRALLGAPLLALMLAPRAARAEGESFAAFLAGIRREAAARGVSAATLDAALRDVTAPDPAVAARRLGQSEFSRPIWAYLAGAVSAGRVARGRALATRHGALLASTERRTGVPPAIVLAVWGMESDFGADAGSVPTIRALATLAHLGHQGSTFREELLAALTILEAGAIAPARMRGSWAGAMGQTQFMPSSYLRHATDGDGDGVADIWGSSADALASTATFLAASGWRADAPWGTEVALPPGFDLAVHAGAFPDFARRGVRRADGAALPGAGSALPGAGSASLFLPAGRDGPAFLLAEANWEAIRAYNTSDAYALAVGHLSDRIAGGDALSRPWPTAAPRLDRDGIRAVQRRLAADGLYAGEADGRLGRRTRDAVRVYQIRAGLVPDGYADPALLVHLTGER